MDIDRYLKGDDFEHLFFNRQWPWQITHFIIRRECFGCDSQINSYLPSHFIIPLEKVKYLFFVNFFWCQYCSFAIYEHYINEECETCHI